MRKHSDFHLGTISTAANPSPFKEGDRVQIPDGRWGKIVSREVETHFWIIKVDKQWMHEKISDLDLQQANKRGE